MRYVILLFALLGTGCASMVVPEFEADTVDCVYHRDGDNIEWECTAKGRGRPLDLPF